MTQLTRPPFAPELDVVLSMMGDQVRITGLGAHPRPARHAAADRRLGRFDMVAPHTTPAQATQVARNA